MKLSDVVKRREGNWKYSVTSWDSNPNRSTRLVRENQLEIS